MESQKRAWNGDVDLNDRSIQNLRQQYDDTYYTTTKAFKASAKNIIELQED